jgi:tetratricopeptide (TPR) repeat protein
MGNLDQAIAWARELGTRGVPVEALGLEARSLLAAGRKADALAAADKGLAAADTPELKSMLLAIRALAGSPDPAADLRQALREDPDNPEALVEMADILAAQGELRKAAAYAHQAALLDPRNASLAQKAADLASRAASAAP